MTRIALLAFVVLAAMAQASQEKTLPPGEFCTPEGRGGGDHRCACHRVDHDASCEGAPIEAPTCAVYCHPAQCRCPIHCEPERG